MLLTLAVPGNVFAHESNEHDETAEQEQTANVDSSSNGNSANKYFSAYKPNYIIASSDGGENSKCDVKFQLSLQQRLSTSDKDDNWKNRFFFGYTQRSFWDICRESAPFRDSTFSPELFHRSKIDLAGGAEHGDRIDLQYGLIHASNGRDGKQSRSWNRAYTEAVYVFGGELGDSWFGKAHSKNWQDKEPPAKLSLGLSAWYIIDTGDENNDIEDYLGYGQLTAKYANKSEQVSLTSWVGTSGKVSVETNLVLKTIPGLSEIPILPSVENTYYWHLQYFDGYGDELLEYDRRQRVFRIGLLFTL